MKYFTILSLLLLTACGPSSTQHVDPKTANPIQRQCADEEKARVRARQASPMALLAQCHKERVMPLFLEAYPDRQAEVHSMYDDIERLSIMHDQGKVKREQVEKFWQNALYDLQFGNLPDCGTHPNARDCVIPTGEGYLRRKASFERR